MNLTGVRGECLSMCPLTEIVSRIELKAINKLESVGSTTDPTLMMATCIKQFRRSSADTALNIPSEIRTPMTLFRTVCYLEDLIIPQYLGFVDRLNFLEALFVYSFVFDRFRMIAKDFSLQRLDSFEILVNIECLERMARWLLVFDSNLLESADTTYSLQHRRLNTQFLMDILKTLQKLYNTKVDLSEFDIHSQLAQLWDYSDSSAVSSPCDTSLLHARNADTFTAYYLFMVLLISRAEYIMCLRSLPSDIIKGPKVAAVMLLQRCLHSGNYVRFFAILTALQDPLLSMLYCCHGIVSLVRQDAIKSLSWSFLKSSLYPVDGIASVLGFKSRLDAIDFLAECEQGVATLSEVQSSSASSAAVSTTMTTHDSETSLSADFTIQRLDAAFRLNSDDALAFAAKKASSSVDSGVEGGDIIFQAIMARHQATATTKTKTNTKPISKSEPIAMTNEGRANAIKNPRIKSRHRVVGGSVVMQELISNPKRLHLVASWK